MKTHFPRPFLVLGQNISARRNQLGLTQEAFAEMANISVGSLKDMERGVTEGWLETRLAVAKSLDCTLSDLYFDPAVDVKVPGPDRPLSSVLLGELSVFLKRAIMARSYPLPVEMVEKLAAMPRDLLEMILNLKRKHMAALRLFLETMTEEEEAQSDKAPKTKR